MDVNVGVTTMEGINYVIHISPATIISTERGQYRSLRQDAAYRDWGTLEKDDTDRAVYTQRGQ